MKTFSRILAVFAFFVGIFQPEAGFAQTGPNPVSIFLPLISNNNTIPSVKKILFTSDRTGDYEIFSINTDGTQLTNITNSPSTEDEWPMMSPDGKKLAYHLGNQYDSQIYIMNADGSQKTDISKRPGTYNCCAAWSPDGKQLTFTSKRDSNYEIYKMNSDGSGQVNLTNNPTVDRISSWSPDGSKIAFYSERNGNQQIYVMHANGNNQTRLTTNSANDAGAAWSPDGTRIAFYSNRDGPLHIFIMAANGAEASVVRLTNSKFDDSLPQWAQDGSEIVFTRYQDGRYQVYTIPITGNLINPVSKNSFNDIQASFTRSGSTPGQPIENKRLAAGYYHTCALTSQDGVKCWGLNSDGELGDGTTVSKSTPVDVVGLTSGLKEVVSGQWHSCALTIAGGVKCWGFNGGGELGDGTTTSRSSPVNVTGLTSGVTSIYAGAGHTCVLTSIGEVKCWGFNSVGQLGDNSTTNRLTPVNVIGLAGEIKLLAGGGMHTCALTDENGVKCWGWNIDGQIGDGTTATRLTPVDVDGLGSGVTSITSGGGHSCAVFTSGGVKCWGDNAFGQLGDGTNLDRYEPTNVVSLTSKVTAISAGSAQTCVLTDAGGVKCWGYNSYGNLGDGTTIDRWVPVDVSGLNSGVTAISAGNHICSRLSNFGIKCWGPNDNGQLGDSSLVDRWTPVSVIGFP